MASEESSTNPGPSLPLSPHDAEAPDWLRTFADIYTPPSLDATRQAQVFAELRYELERAIEMFGYEAVYFGVACEVFSDSIDPWAGNEQ